MAPTSRPSSRTNAAAGAAELAVRHGWGLREGLAPTPAPRGQPSPVPPARRRRTAATPDTCRPPAGPGSRGRPPGPVSCAVALPGTESRSPISGHFMPRAHRPRSPPAHRTKCRSPPQPCKPLGQSSHCLNQQSGLNFSDGKHFSSLALGQEQHNGYFEALNTAKRREIHHATNDTLGNDRSPAHHGLSGPPEHARPQRPSLAVRPLGPGHDHWTR